MKLIMSLALVALGLLLVQRFAFSFMAQRPAQYADTSPVFDARINLGGEMISEGVIFGPTGRMSARFVAQMRGTWTGDSAVLSETFRYATGNTQRREWRIQMGTGGAFTAKADDIVGEATGQQSGATLRMLYRLRLPPEAGGWVLDVTDWLYLAEDGTILNRSQFRRFGVKVGELVATIRPVVGP